MIQPMQEGICAFVAKKINGVLHIAIQAKIEIGNMDVVEFAPTVQSLNDNYHQTKSDQPPFLREVLNATKEKIVFDALQSEEGGRFYQDQNRYLMVIADQDLPEKLPDNYIWMTLNQLQIFMQFNNYLNIQTRSLMAAVPFI
jgi:oxidase EvaA